MTVQRICRLALCIITTCLIAATIGREARAGDVYKESFNTVGFLTVEKQVYEKVSEGGQDKMLEVWYRDPISNERQPKSQTESGTYFSLEWHGATYMVTAKHTILDAAGKPAKQGMFNFNDKDGKRRALTFESMENHEGSRWFLHDSADVAIHPMWRPAQIEMDLVSVRTISTTTNEPQKGATTNEPQKPATPQKPVMLDSVYAIGFPFGLGVGESLSPIAKECKIASLKQELSLRDDNGLPISGGFIILDQALAQGYSGAPIYFCPGSNSYLLGLMSSVNTDATGGKISLVVPLDYVFEVLNSPQFVSYEKLLGHGGVEKPAGDRK